MSEERGKILSAVLGHVPFEGWTERALRLAAGEAGLDPATAELAFPGGPADAIVAWSAVSDLAMLDAYAEANPDDMRFRDRIAFLVRARIEAVADHREAVRRAITHMSRPPHLRRGTRALYRTVDDMWYAAGDRSTDFSFYTKRATLAAVYTSTMLFWLDDRSEGSAETWAFLDRRIENVMQIPKVREKIGGAATNLPDPRRFARLVAERLREGGAL
ncbi:MAG: COQ9 family protein [Alphaproteobacteria bacterium]|nr:COQ9 family protein [Alphaproteobacteria bacterium]